MLRLLSALFIASALLLIAPSQVHAQPQARAYAPDNLRELSYNDQVRVIRQEYSEQSNGRRIPDDQLSFYIDQINRSDWGFSRIKQDIATSLRGNQGGWNPGPGPGPGQGSSLVCESRDNRYNECRTGFRGRAVLTQNISNTRCVEGQNWGSGNGTVWVDRGCSGRFADGRGSGNGSGSNRTARCESPDGRTVTCNTGFRGRAVLPRQLSSTRCIENQNWGQRRGSIWVSSGCRAEFSERSGNWNQGNGGWNQGGGSGNWNQGNSNYSVTCASADGRRSTCAWDSRQGRPVLEQQLSSQSCREGQNWGFMGNQIWVDRGCRARFGVGR
ncbi:MAG: DUF3011 domain-containing protein [Pseudoxanthomonas sp.]|nr:DUF3011 domain-containing protein [Pseudoxanthomonas sp.]